MVEPSPQDDPFQVPGSDPWNTDRSPTAPPGASATADDDAAAAEASRNRGRSRAFATGAPTRDLPPPIRVIHDNPPSWSGDNPDKELEPYLKMLRGWLITTRTLKAQQGMTIFNHATGDLNLIINELETDVLFAEDSGEVVYKHIQTSFAEYAEKKLPQSIENCIYDKNVARRRGEGMLQYCIRRDKLFKSLAKEGWSIPDEAKGYILLRDAILPEKARDLIEMWSEGDYEYSIRKCKSFSKSWSAQLQDLEGNASPEW